MRTSTSADAIDDDQWWLEDDAVEEATVKEIKVSSSKKTTAIEQVSLMFIGAYMYIH